MIDLNKYPTHKTDKTDKNTGLGTKSLFSLGLATKAASTDKTDKNTTQPTKIPEGLFVGSAESQAKQGSSQFCRFCGDFVGSVGSTTNWPADRAPGNFVGFVGSVSSPLPEARGFIGLTATGCTLPVEMVELLTQDEVDRLEYRARAFALKDQRPGLFAGHLYRGPLDWHLSIKTPTGWACCYAGEE